MRAYQFTKAELEGRKQQYFIIRDSHLTSKQRLRELSRRSDRSKTTSLLRKSTLNSWSRFHLWASPEARIQRILRRLMLIGKPKPFLFRLLKKWNFHINPSLTNWISESKIWSKCKSSVGHGGSGTWAGAEIQRTDPGLRDLCWYQPNIHLYAFSVWSRWLGPLSSFLIFLSW